MAERGLVIGVLTGTFHPETGGPPTYLYLLLPELVAAGQRVEVLTFGEPSPDDAAYGYPVTRVSRVGGRAARWRAYFRAAFGMARRADVLFVMGFVLPLPLLRLGFRRRVVAKVVSDWSWEYADRSRQTTLDVDAYQAAALLPRLAALRAAYRFAVRRADLVIVPSQHVARLVHGWGVPDKRVRVIYNAVPDAGLHATRRAMLRAELSAEHGLPPGAPWLASVARLTPVKGVDVLLRVLVELPAAHAVIAGDGPSEGALRALAESLGVAGRAHFLGRQPHDTVLRLMRAADVFVLSSRTEGLSHVLLEALSVATPAVASRVGGNPEILTHEVDGLLVPPDDPAALAEAIRRVLDDSTLAERLAQAGRARYADFAWETTVAATLAALVGE